MPRSVQSASAILPILSLQSVYGSLKPLTLTVIPASKRQCLLPVVGWCLGIGPHGIRGPLAKTGAYPTSQTPSNCHNSALLAPGRRDPVENFLEHRVTGQSAPGSFDEQVTHATGALTASMATSHRGARRILAGRQPRITAQRPLIGKAGHITQLSRQGPGDHRADARDAPRHFFEFRLRGGLFLQQAAYLERIRISFLRIPPSARLYRGRRWGEGV